MSDTSRGPGWWRASDGKWYAPEQHPDYRPEQHPDYRPAPAAELAAPPQPAFAPRRVSAAQDGRLKRGWRKFRGLPPWAQVTIGVVLAVIVIGAAAGGDDSKEQVSIGPTTTFNPALPPTNAGPTLPPVTTRPSTTPAPTPPTTATPTTPAGPKTTFGAGTFRVGVDIAPGTYVAPGGSGCYWERQSVFGGGFDSIIANEFAPGQGQVVVTIAASDKGFKTSGCGTWRPG